VKISITVAVTSKLFWKNCQWKDSQHRSTYIFRSCDKNRVPFAACQECIHDLVEGLSKVLDMPRRCSSNGSTDEIFQRGRDQRPGVVFGVRSHSKVVIFANYSRKLLFKKQNNILSLFCITDGGFIYRDGRNERFNWLSAWIHYCTYHLCGDDNGALAILISHIACITVMRPVATHVARFVVSVCVCLAHRWALQKRMNWSRYRLRPKGSCIRWVHIGATWCTRLNDPCVAAMRPYVEWLWPLVKL